MPSAAMVSRARGQVNEHRGTPLNKGCLGVLAVPSGFRGRPPSERLTQKYANSTLGVWLVVDASSLITLAGADALGLLSLSPLKACTVAEVYRETVEVGLARGYRDAPAISRAFEQGLLTIRDPRRAEKLTGISRTDSLLLHLAEETGAEILVNDQALLRKAEERGLPARVTAEFVQRLYKAKKISGARRDALLKDFVANGRYSEDFLLAFLLRE